MIKDTLEKMLEQAKDENEILAIEDCIYASSLSNTALTHHMAMWEDVLGNESLEEAIYQRKIIQIKEKIGEYL